MSLDGIVFKNVKKLEQQFGEGMFWVDEDGQGCPHTEPVYPEGWKPNYEVAHDEWIGNIWHLGELREKLKHVQSDGMILRILKRETLRTNSDRFDQFSAELLEIADIPDLKELVGKIRRLMAAALKEGNPIVWV